MRQRQITTPVAVALILAMLFTLWPALAVRAAYVTDSKDLGILNQG